MRDFGLDLGRSLINRRDYVEQIQSDFRWFIAVLWLGCDGRRTQQHDDSATIHSGCKPGWIDRVGVCPGYYWRQADKENTKI